MKMELLALGVACLVLSQWVMRGQGHLRKRTLPQIYAEARAGRVRAPLAGLVLSLLGCGLVTYAVFWL